MTSDSPFFCYHELDRDSRSFRLMRLLPSVDFDAEVCCELFESSLVSCPGYEAISYVWGDPSITVPIWIHDTTHSVTTNLGLALRYLRLAEEERIVWVDALCINQADSVEKNRQVRQMRSIYVGAERVIVWFGEEDNAGQGLRYLTESKALAERKPIKGRRKWTISDYYANDQKDWDSLLARPWWTRMWTLQEVIHDRPVTAYIGSTQINFDDLCLRARFYQQSKLQKELYPSMVKLSHGPPQPPSVSQGNMKYHGALSSGMFSVNAIGIIFSIRDLNKSAHDELPLRVMLYNTREQQCSDPRDKVYALVGMTDFRRYEQLINYEISKEGSYKLTMACLLASKGGINSLLQVESPERLVATGRLPSWVPDWSTSQTLSARAMSLFCGDFCSYKDVATARRFCSAERISISRGILNIPGIYIGVITRVSVVGLDFEGISLECRSLKLFEYDQDASRDLLPRVSEDEAASPMDMFHSSWGPYWAESGDIIIVTPLCSVPLVVRRDGDTYLFVGGCWLVDSELQSGTDSQYKPQHDPGFSTIMHGSAWDETKLEDFLVK